ncbi:acyl-CoA thioesterase [Streptomyces botrytidirepellens]|uniref:Acyl-CoA thioesterase n=2 Tax=Streptomyces botrytidirepellens TaxID=2486417 RepID=A0A3M8SFD1_9ACTN|nr:acyl-CoA thioesterase [Streptomyces botrytidirepellens]
MPRTSTYEVVLDAGMFAPTQLQVTTVGRLGFQAGTRWVRDHVCSHRRLVSEHGVGLVLWAWQLEYEKPLRFHDADAVTIDVAAQVRGPRASQLEFETTLSGPAGVAVRTRAASVPLQLSGDSALSGTPATLPGSLVTAFHDDEVERTPYRSPVRALQAQFEREGELLASSTEDLPSFRIHRHHCEVADQWYWAESLGFAGGAREEFVRRHGTNIPELRDALSDGIRRIDATWLRTGQLWDLLQVRTTVHRHREGIAFVHALESADEDDRPYAIIVERT